jgi:hypothetical protein
MQRPSQRRLKRVSGLSDKRSFCKCASNTVLSANKIVLQFHAYVGRSHISSVSIVTWLQAEQKGIWVQFPAGSIGFPLLHSVPTLETHRGSRPKCSRGFSPKYEVAAMWSWTSSCHGSWSRTRTTLPYFTILLKRPSSEPHGAVRQQAIAKTPAKWSAYQIPSVTVVFVVLLYKV